MLGNAALGATRHQRWAAMAVGVAALALVATGTGSAPAFASIDEETLSQYEVASGETSTITVPGSPASSSAVSQAESGDGNVAALENQIAPQDVDLDTPRVDASTGVTSRPSEMSPRIVIGADERTRVRDVTTAPYSQMALILYNSGTTPYMCSGTLVGNRTFVTAGHCLHSGGVWSTDVQVLFGMEGTTYRAGCYPSTLTAPNSWINNASRADDWGVIQLACNAGNALGHLGVRDVGTGAVSGNATVTGYPGDKAAELGGYYLFQHAGALQSYNAKQFSYTIDTAGGQSGGGIWRNESGCGNCVLGVHTAGSTQLNFGTRMTGAFKSAVDQYKAQ